MTQRQNNYNLLKVLQAHYNQLVNLIAALRLKSYRPEAKSNSSRKLAQQLQNYINHFPATKLDTPVSATQDDNHAKVTEMKTTRLEKEKATPEDQTHSGPVFSDKHQISSVGEKLMQSTWDHLHASIRYARAGNEESARLHASIMDSALKEAVHFLDEEAYNEFILNLGKEMSKLVWADEPDAIKQAGSNRLH